MKRRSYKAYKKCAKFLGHPVCSRRRPFFVADSFKKQLNWRYVAVLATLRECGNTRRRGGWTDTCGRRQSSWYGVELQLVCPSSSTQRRRVLSFRVRVQSVAATAAAVSICRAADGDARRTRAQTTSRNSRCAQRTANDATRFEATERPLYRASTADRQHRRYIGSSTLTAAAAQRQQQQRAT